ncbi:MAG: hypothetical protein AB7T14_09460, partial [Candidatus Methylacidiphilaceae bacterium]
IRLSNSRLALSSPLFVLFDIGADEITKLFSKLSFLPLLLFGQRYRFVLPQHDLEVLFVFRRQGRKDKVPGAKAKLFASFNLFRIE